MKIRTTTYIIIAILISLVLISGCSYKAKAQLKEENINAVHFFYNDNCTDCVTEKEYLFKLSDEIDFELRLHEIPKNQALWELMTAELGTTPTSVPMTIIDGKVFSGFYEQNGSLEKNPNNAYKGFKNQIYDAIKQLS